MGFGNLCFGAKGLMRGFLKLQAGATHDASNNQNAY
jgi:hypothetical protein